MFYSDEDGGYLAGIPDLEHCSAFGSAPEQALMQALIAKNAWRKPRAAGREGLIGKKHWPWFHSAQNLSHPARAFAERYSLKNNRYQSQL